MIEVTRKKTKRIKNLTDIHTADVAMLKTQITTSCDDVCTAVAVKKRNVTKSLSNLSPIIRRSYSHTVNYVLY